MELGDEDGGSDCDQGYIESTVSSRSKGKGKGKIKATDGDHNEEDELSSFSTIPTFLHQHFSLPTATPSVRPGSSAKSDLSKTSTPFRTA